LGLPRLRVFVPIVMNAYEAMEIHRFRPEGNTYNMIDVQTDALRRIFKTDGRDCQGLRAGFIGYSIGNGSITLGAGSYERARSETAQFQGYARLRQQRRRCIGTIRASSRSGFSWTGPIRNILPMDDITVIDPRLDAALGGMRATRAIRGPQTVWHERSATRPTRICASARKSTC